jgi:predicted nicotinamide N-methyase
VERSAAEQRAFVLAQTRLAAVPGLDGVVLRTADAAFPLWHEAADWLKRGELALPFWAFPWAGGVGLAHHLQLHPELVAGRDVTDVASGSGLVGIVAAKFGALQVHCLDIDPMAAEAAALNAVANGIELVAETADVTALAPRGGLILAGDICYEGPMASALLAWLRSCAEAGAEVLLGDPGRHYLDASGMVCVGRYLLPSSRELEAGDEAVCSVYRLV